MRSKKRIAGLLAVIMIICQVNIVVANETTTMSQHWASNVIEKWIDRGWIDSYSNINEFRPNQEITRAEFVVMTNAAFKIPAYTTESNFTDVSKEDWYYDDITSAQNDGYIDGYINGAFQPKANITRQEVAKVIATMLDITQHYKNTLEQFSDYKKIGEWAKPSVNGLVGYGLITGYPDNTFGYNKTMTRAEALVTLDRAYELVGQFTGALVTVIKDQNALANVTIKVHDKDSKVVQEVVTNENGMAEIKPLSAGTYTIKVTKDSYSTEEKVTVRDGFTTIKELHLNQTSKPAGTISGGGSSNKPSTSTPSTNTPVITGDLSVVFDTGTFEQMDEKVYAVNEKVSAITGKIEGKSTIKELKYIVKSGEMELDSGELTPQATWKIEDIVLLVGVNEITVVATDSGGKKVEESLYLYNTNAENMGNVILDGSDTDGDGLLNYQEAVLGADIELVDTDKDGLSDYEEALITLTNPTLKDTDANGIEDGKEDFDNDGLNNLEEIELGTNPFKADTDNDDLDDKKETELGTNPLKSDTDEDGLSDGKEIELGTDPLNPDTNGNGILDGDEKFNITYTPEEVDENVVPTLNINLSGSVIDTLEINKLEKDDVFLSSDMPGFIGCAYDFSVNEEFDEAELTFKFSSEYKSVEGFEPAIYYFNETTQGLELLENQIIDWENCTVTTTLEHFSTYILLNKKAFEEVWEQEIKVALEEEKGQDLDVIFVIDRSASMYDNDPQYIRKQTAIAFAEKLSERDRAGVISFTKVANVHCDLTTSSGVIVEKIQGIRNDSGYTSKSGTATHRGIKEALVQFETYNVPNRKKVMIVLTDGEDTENGDYNALIVEAQEQDVMVYTIGLGYAIDATLLETIAQSTGGEYYHASVAQDLIDNFEGIGGELIGIYKDTDGDGLSDYHEKNIRLGNGKKIETDILEKDTDLDEISDFREVEPIYYTSEECIKYDVKPGAIKYYQITSNPLEKDTDKDGVTDKEDEDPMVWDVSDRDLAILSQAVYLNEIKVGNKLHYRSNTALNKKFYDTASLQEMYDWKLIYRQHDNLMLNDDNKNLNYNERLKEDAIYGGFKYDIYQKDDNIVIAFRGSVGEMGAGFSEQRGDWYNNLVKYPFNMDPAKKRIEDEIEMILDNEKFENKNIYITGHSRGGFLSQNAAYQFVVNDEEDRLEKLVYFNGIGIVPGEITHIVDMGAAYIDETLLRSVARDYGITYEGSIFERIAFQIERKHEGKILLSTVGGTGLVVGCKKLVSVIKGLFTGEDDYGTTDALEDAVYMILESIKLRHAVPNEQKKVLEEFETIKAKVDSQRIDNDIVSLIGRHIVEHKTYDGIDSVLEAEGGLFAPHAMANFTGQSELLAERYQPEKESE